MKLIKIWSRISWVIAVGLSVFYMVGAIIFYQLGATDKIAQALITSGVFFLLSLMLSKIKGQNQSFKKVMQAQTYLLQHHKLNKDGFGKEEEKIKILLFLSEVVSFKRREKTLFEDTNWSLKSGELINEAVKLASSMIPKLYNLISQGMDTTLMIPLKDLNKEDIEILNEVVEKTQNLSYVQIRRVVPSGDTEGVDFSKVDLSPLEDK